MILPPVSTVIKQTLEAQGVTDLEELRRQQALHVQHAQHARDAPAKSRAEAVQGEERPEGKGKRSSNKSANVTRDKSKRQKTRSSSASGKSVHSAGGAIGQAGEYFVAPGGFYPIGGHATVGGSGSPASDKHALRAGSSYPGHKLAHGVMGMAIAAPSTGAASGSGSTLGPSGAGTSSRGTSGGGGPSGSGSSGSSGLGSPLLPGGYNANGTAMLSAANLQAAAAHVGMLVPLAPAHHIPGATVGMSASSYHRPVGGPQLPGGLSIPPSSNSSSNRFNGGSGSSNSPPAGESREGSNSSHSNTRAGSSDGSETVEDGDVAKGGGFERRTARKEYHKKIERRRRDRMSKLYDELRALTGCAQTDKNGVLESSIALITDLQNENRRLLETVGDASTGSGSTSFGDTGGSGSTGGSASAGESRDSGGSSTPTGSDKSGSEKSGGKSGETEGNTSVLSQKATESGRSSFEGRAR